MKEKITIDGSIFVVEIVSSAYKYGQTEDDILSALKNCIYDETIEENPNKTLAVGYDRNANFLEIIFHVINDEYIVVFHAMPCRKQYIKRMVGR